jgi:hypothetical protein
VARAGGKTAKYVYGVVRARSKSSPKLKGINGKPLRVVASGGLGALTSDVPDGPVEAGREELLAHSRVLEQAIKRGVVLPMRFGVVMPTESSVRDDLLDAHREELERQLDEMDGKVEVNVKGMYEEQSVLREVMEQNPEVVELRESLQGKPEDATYYERIRLGELVAEELSQKRAVDQQRVVDRLAKYALAIDAGEPMHERMAVNASFLVDQDHIGDFDRALDELGSEEAQRIRFKYTGPLPPHSFVELSVEA